MAVPSFERSIERRRLEGTAAQLETDVHYARSLAVARNAPVRMSFSAPAGATCYVIHTGAAGQCDCSPSGRPVCSGGAEPLFFPVESTQKGLKGITVITYLGVPEPGMLTAITYGISLTDHPEWKFGKPELCITVRSDDVIWARRPLTRLSADRLGG